MKKFLQDLVIAVLLWTIAIVVLGVTEVMNPGFVLYSVGIATGVMYTVWRLLSLCHDTVVKDIKYLISSNDREYLKLPGPVRNRSETSSSFFCWVSPAKVSKNIHKVKRGDYSDISFYIKSGPVRSDLALIPVSKEQEQHHWLSSLSDQEILDWLRFLNRQDNQHFVKFALNELKRRSVLGRIAPSQRIYAAEQRPVVAVDAQVV